MFRDSSFIVAWLSAARRIRVDVLLRHDLLVTKSPREHEQSNSPQQMSESEIRRTRRTDLLTCSEETSRGTEGTGETLGYGVETQLSRGRDFIF